MRLGDLRLPVSAFLREAFGHLGAEWEETPDGVMLALLPGDPDIRRITLDPEVAREEPGVDLAAPGSRVVEGLARRGLARGRLARGFAAPPDRPPPPLRGAFQLDAPRTARTEWVREAWTTWVFAFQASYLGEFRRDALHITAVDGATLRQVRRFEEAFSALVLADEGPDPARDLPFDACYRSARDEVMGKVLAEFRAEERDAEEALDREIARQESYYRGLQDEMAEDALRLAPDDPRRQTIATRAEATRADRDRSLAQARERHRLLLEVEVLGALGVVYPRHISTLTLFGDDGARAEATLVWDPVFEQFEPLVCPACGKPTYALALTRQGPSCGCR